jgi:hypothetical protein
MAVGTNADLAFLQKIIYPNGYDPKALVMDKPGVANTPHKKNFTTGKTLEIPAPYSTPQGVSANIINAASNASTSLGVSFGLTQCSYFAQLRLDGRLVANARAGNADSQFAEQFKHEADNVEDAIGWELERQMFGTQAGYRGVIASVTIGANSTITLNRPTDVIFFRKNMVLVVGTTATGAVRVSASTTITVNRVDSANGVLYFDSQNIGTIFSDATPANYVGNFLFRQGDAQNGASAGVIAAGLDDWNRASAPSATLFFGVDRSVAPVELAGVRYDGSNDQPQSVFINARAAFMQQTGRAIKKGVFYINPGTAAGLRNAYESKRILEGERATKYEISIDSFKIDNIEFIEAPAMAPGRAKFVADGAFVRASCGDQPDWQKLGDAQFWTDPDTNTVKGLILNYGNFAAMRVNELMDVTLPPM